MCFIYFNENKAIDQKLNQKVISSFGFNFFQLLSFQKSYKRSATPLIFAIVIFLWFQDYRVILMDSIVSTGAAALMAVRVLLDHDVPEENISLGKSVFKQNM